MNGLPAREVTQLLLAWSRGDKSALDQLTPVVYHELLRIAQGYMARERSDHTLQPTALIHEAYVRLVDQSLPEFNSRTHFFGVAAQLMRQVLVDYARKRGAARRGGGERKVTLDEAVVFSQERSQDLLALDEALEQLGKLDPRKCQIGRAHV